MLIGWPGPWAEGRPVSPTPTTWVQWRAGARSKCWKETGQTVPVPAPLPALPSGHYALGAK